MIFGETYSQREARRERQRTSFPELDGSDVREIMAVDSLRRSEGRESTSFGMAIENTTARIRPPTPEHPGGTFLNPLLDPIQPYYDQSEDELVRQTNEAALYAPPPDLGAVGMMGPVGPEEDRGIWDTIADAGRAAFAVNADVIQRGMTNLSRPAAAIRSVLGDSPPSLGGGLMGTRLGDVNRSAEAGVEGFTNPESAPRGIDVPGIRDLPDEGLQIGPVNLTPRTVAGFGYETLTDPLTYVGGPKAAQGAKKGLGAVDDFLGDAPKGYIDPARRGTLRSQVLPGVGPDEVATTARRSEVAGAVEDAVEGYTAPPTLRRLFGTQDIVEGQQRGIGERLGMSGRLRADDPVVTPALRVRDEAREAVKNQATNVTVATRRAVRDGGFDVAEDGTIASLGGIDQTLRAGVNADGAVLAPTIRDVAARYPVYERYLTPAQRTAMEKLRALAAPYRQALDEVIEAETKITGKPSSIQIGSRADVMDGGFYLPRGTAETEELADIASRRLRLPGAKTGGKQSFEKTATYPSEAAGIADGYGYTPIDEAMGSYVRGTGNRALDRHTANYLLSRVDETGKRIAQTRADRIDPELPALVQGLRQRISGRLQTLRNQTVRGGAQQSEAQRYERLAERLADLTERSRGRAGALPTAQEARALDTEAAAALREAVTRGRTITRDLTNLQRSTTPIRSGAQRSNAEITALTDELAQALEQADTLTGRARGQIRRFGGDAAELPPEAAFEVRTAQAKYAESLRAADRVQKAIERLAERATKQETALEAAGVRRSTLTELRNIATSDVSAAVADLRAAGNTDAALRVAQRELRVLENQARQAGNRAGAAGARAGRTAAKRQGTIDEITALRAELDELTPRYQRAQELAAQTPRDQGTIPLAGLEAYSFPWEMADEATRALRSESPNSGEIDSALRLVNGIFRGVQATGEMSYFGIQMPIGLVTTPRGGGRAAKAATKAWLNSGDEVLGDFIARTDARDAAQGLPDTEWWAAHGLRLAEAGTEFRLGGARDLGPTARKVADAAGEIASKPGIKQVLSVPRSLVKRADRGYGVAGDTMRRELVSTLAAEARLKGIPLDDAWGRTTAESANRVTGWTPQRAFGSWGELANFAPRFLAARVRTVGQLASADPLKRAQARRLIGRYTALMSTMTIAANYLNGEETDFRPFSGKNGPTYDPREAEYKNPNFMRVMNVAGRDWSLQPGLDSLMGIGIGVMSLGTNPTGDPQEITKRIRTIFSAPLASLGLDWMVFGENFEGDELALDTPEGQRDLLQRALPMAAPDLAGSAAQVAEKVQDGDYTGAASEAAGGVGQGLLGGRASRVSPREQVERGQYGELEPMQELEVHRTESWEKVKYAMGGSTEDTRTYSVWRQREIAKNVEAFKSAGESLSSAHELAKKMVDDDPVSKAYTTLRNDLEDEWGVMHPKEAAALLDKEAAQALKDPGFRPTFQPTKKVREFIEASR